MLDVRYSKKGVSLKKHRLIIREVAHSKVKYLSDGGGVE